MIGAVLALLLTGCAAPSPRIGLTLFLDTDGPATTAPFHLPAVGQVRISLQSAAPRDFSASLTCNGPAEVHGRTRAYLRPGGSFRFSLATQYGPKTQIVLPPETTSCRLTYGEYSQTLARPRAHTAAAATASDPAPCPKTTPQSALHRVFLRQSALSQSCPLPTRAARLVPDEMEALILRLEALTGSDIPAAALETLDPDMALDFSAAPHFETILISHLLIRADLSGYLVARALAFHAERGTKVRILTTKIMEGEKDMALLERLASRYPNISVQYFAYTGGPLSGFDHLQRTNHIKLFAGVASQPSRSFALIGGRNLRDGYHFPENINFPDHPFLNVYEEDGRQGLVFYTSYDDLDFYVTGPPVHTIARHFESFWYRDEQGQKMIGTEAGREPENGPAPVTGASMRHFISVPWQDGQALEAHLVALIDAARHSIRMIGPFNYPTPKLEAALLRARARGVEIRMVSRSGGDKPAVSITRTLNRGFVQKYRDALQIRLYQGDLKLHEKAMVIDGQLSLFGSVNFNHRSFRHDSENGLLVWDRGVARALTQHFDEIWRAADREGEINGQKWVELLFKALPALKDYF